MRSFTGIINPFKACGYWGFYPTPAEMEKKIDIFLKSVFCIARNKRSERVAE
ncbi:hypothetical protein VB265_07155 [Enterobacter sichuanensis]|uniref:hypothetical protein n=1 Tax=Enterobacter TaxID=547 RepID=UPI00258DA227|nr:MULTISPECIES: hypothetical protein [Enterobacter]MCI8906049.1 hypothetical protein [Enterobacter sp.]MEA5169292.1 hypothetical protein [Enterobacter sichuanensis]